MNTQVKLSFVIPFYNGGKYIRECIESLYLQDIPKNDYEVLIVDDCSSNVDDISLIQALEAFYPTLHIIYNERNMRCGGSRNVGLLKAQGEYIWFVDQDDFIAPNSLGSILKICFQERLDILYFDYCNVSDDRTLKKKCNIVKKQTEVVSGLEYISQYCSGDFWQSDYDTNVWHSVYRRDFMVKNKVFSPEVSYCEDMIVSLNAIIVAKRIMAIESDYYCYRYNSASVFHTEVGVKGRAMFDASLYAGSEIIRLSKFIPSSYKNLCETVKAGGIYRINSFTKRLLKLTCKQRCIFFELISRNRDVVAFCNDYLSSVNKWIITHSLIVQLMPHIIYLYVNLKKQS